jgi:hypothetical protein
MDGQFVNEGAHRNASGMATRTTPPPIAVPDPSGGGRMSGRVFSATIATAMIGVFILTYALSRNRVEETPPAPHAATTEASGANWPSP